jgi:hypothetical protein
LPIANAAAGVRQERPLPLAGEPQGVIELPEVDAAAKGQSTIQQGRKTTGWPVSLDARVKRKIFFCPNEMVPLQIDRAIELGRYLPVHLPNHRTSPVGRSDEYRTSEAPSATSEGPVYESSRHGRSVALVR